MSGALLQAESFDREKIMNSEERLIEVVNKLREMKIDSYQGLPEELFLFVSGITPIPNVDLMITNEKGQLLLSWRDDLYFGRGWHIPGGCIRFGETMIERVQKTAVEEIGTEVIAREEPLAVRDVICHDRNNLKYPNERGHHITILYECKLPDGFEISNGTKKEMDAGYLKWFDKIPENILRVHDVYEDILTEWEKRRK